MKPGNEFEATIQHYQEALACLEVACRYLRCGELPDAHVPSPDCHEDNNNYEEYGAPNYDAFPNNESNQPLSPPLSSSYSGGCSAEGCLRLGSSGSNPECCEGYRPNAREPVRRYMLRNRRANHEVIEALIDRCTDSMTAIKTHSDNHNQLVKESLQSLLESLRFQKRLLEKRKRKMAKEASNAATLPTIPSVTPSPHPCVPPSILSAVTAMRLSPSSVSEGLEGVIGLQEVKEVLTEAFVLPAQFPHLFEGGALSSWSRLLLFGPPGTGKTKLARSLAAELKCSLYLVTPSMLMSSWLGDTEKIIREVFSSARSEEGPSIIFLDEVDALCRVRSSKEDDVTRRIKTELLVHLDTDSEPMAGDEVFSFDNNEFTSPSQRKVFVIAATNCPWDVDPAFLRRFERKCYVDLPMSLERQLLLQSCLSGCSSSLSPSDWSSIADSTDGFSGADLKSVATAAAFRPIKELHSATFWHFTQDNKIMPCSSDTLGAMQYTLDKLPANRVTVRPVQLEDVLCGVKAIKRSAPTALLQRYKQYQMDN